MRLMLYSFVFHNQWKNESALTYFMEIFQHPLQPTEENERDGQTSSLNFASTLFVFRMSHWYKCSVTPDKIPFVLSNMAPAVAFQTFIIQVTGSNFGRDTDYPEVTGRFPQSLQKNTTTVPLITPRPLPSTSISSDYSLMRSYRVVKYTIDDITTFVQS
jgi:hypothetical protein